MKTFISEVVVPRYSVENVFLEILQNTQENACARVSFLIKLQAFAKFLRTLSLQNTSGGCFCHSFMWLQVSYQLYFLLKLDLAIFIFYNQNWNTG